MKRERTSKESSLHLAEVVKAAGMGVWFWDAKTGSVEWDERMHALHDVEPGGFAGTRGAWLDRVHPDDRHVLECMPSMPRSDGRLFEAEYRAVLPGGSVRHVETRGVPVRPAGARAPAMVGVARDVTARRRDEEALRDCTIRLAASEDLRGALFNRATDGIMLMSVGGNGAMVNAAFARMHGYAPEEMNSARLYELDTPATARQATERLQRLAAGDTMTFEVEHYHRDGHVVPLRVTCSVVSIGGQPHFLGFHQDLSELRDAARQVLGREGAPGAGEGGRGSDQPRKLPDDLAGGTVHRRGR